jgi:hypothetical protein
VLIEIVGDRLNGPKHPRGLVFCDPAGPSGWAVVVVVPDQERALAELRIYPSDGLESVTCAPDAFALQIISTEQAEQRYADLLPMALEVLPKAAHGVAEIAAASPAQVELYDGPIWEPVDEETSTMPFELPIDEPVFEELAIEAAPLVSEDVPAVSAEARLQGIMLEAATMAMTGFARVKTLWKSMMSDTAVSPRTVAWATGQHQTATKQRGPVTVEMVAPPAPSAPAPVRPRIVLRRRS